MRRPMFVSLGLCLLSLAGLELYVGFQETPVEFEAPGVHCGALVLWTRDR